MLYTSISTFCCSIQDIIRHSLSTQIKEEMKLGFKAHTTVFEDNATNAVLSRSVTPSPQVIDTQVCSNSSNARFSGKNIPEQLNSVCQSNNNNEFVKCDLQKKV